MQASRQLVQAKALYFCRENSKQTDVLDEDIAVEKEI
jgi:hypothetical protein